MGWHGQKGRLAFRHGTRYPGGMQRLLFSLLCLSVVACAAHDYEAAGVSVYLSDTRNGPSEDEMKESLQFFREMAPRYLTADEDKINDRFGNLHIFWDDGFIPCEPYGRCSGTQSGDWIHVVWYGCIADTALFHELGHWVDSRIMGHDPDYDHENDLLWSRIGALKTLWSQGPGWSYCLESSFPDLEESEIDAPESS